MDGREVHTFTGTPVSSIRTREHADLGLVLRRVHSRLAHPGMGFPRSRAEPHDVLLPYRT